MKDLLIIADEPFWAYHNHLEFLKKHFNDHLNIYYDYVVFNKSKRSYKSSYIRLYYKYKHNRFYTEYTKRNIRRKKSFDAVIFLGFYMPFHMKVRFNADIILKGIFTDGFPPRMAKPVNIDINGFIDKYLHDCDGLICGSELIKNYYSKYHDTVFYANMCYDEDIFKRKIIKEYDTKKLTIGWTGNPNTKFKHFHDILVPAVNKVKQLRPEVVFKTRFNGPMDTLPDFYNDVDLVLIASDKDAGPSMFREAGLMNIPAISTKIGHPYEVIEHLENGLFVADNTVNEFVEKIIYLYDKRDLLIKMSNRIRRDVIDQLGVKRNIRRWQSIFNYFDLV